ncbi:TetR/AcrR family transcriptional regulator [Microbacterium sp. A94]|uniref:TetR/AcrR family transcriptional regulator n=1 Tax=Microbacterium sp. A94 TaxID=3450717 RepID=UPI003F4427BF
MARPRSEKARQAVLAAMRNALATGGYETATIEGLAAEAEVSKQTIYRWWPSKSAILGEALLEGELPGNAPPVPMTTDLGTDLREWVSTMMARIGTTENTALARALIAVNVADPELGAQLNQRFTEPIIGWITERIERGKQAGEVRVEIDAAAVANQFAAAASYAALLGRKIDDAQADALGEVLMRGIAVPEASAS